MEVTIDRYAGFCFGVERAIRIAEDNMFGDNPLFSLGELVHNEEENQRLEKKGLKTIAEDYFVNLKHGRVLFRAHGEPPSSYEIGCRNQTKVIDATCPIVRKLQTRVKRSHREIYKKNGMVLIFGGKDHPEVIGLLGQVPGNIMAVDTVEDIKNAALPPVIRLFSQTTRGTEDYLLIQDAIRHRLTELHPYESIDFKSYNTICSQVSGRVKRIGEFAASHEVILFVAGKDSSNGKLLFTLAREVNPRSYYISQVEEIDPQWFGDCNDVGISGATSTPGWLMEKISEAVKRM